MRCLELADMGHPITFDVAYRMANAILQKKEAGQKLGKKWFHRYLQRRPKLDTVLSVRIEDVRAAAELSTLEDYFGKVENVSTRLCYQ